MIGDMAFFHCSALESITFPSTLTEIGMNSFGSCSSLKELVPNEGLKKIGTKAFHHCSSLLSITLPSTLTDTGITVFAHCINLKQVLLKEGLQTINLCAFYECESLERISLPSTLDEIGYFAFRGCTNLRVVEFHGIVQKIGEDAFTRCQSLEKFTTPSLSSRLENIIQTGHWSEVEDKIDEIRGLVQRRGSEIFISAADMSLATSTLATSDNNWDTIKASLDQITSWIRYYEIKEATTTLELALWKFKINQADDADDINRGACCIDVPGPVKGTILQYLG